MDTPKASMWRPWIFAAVVVAFLFFAGDGTYSMYVSSLDLFRDLAAALARNSRSWLPGFDSNRVDLGQSSEVWYEDFADSTWIQQTRPDGTSMRVRSYSSPEVFSGWLFSPFAVLHALACAGAVAAVRFWGHPRIAVGNTISPFFAPRFWGWMILVTAVPAILLLALQAIVRMYWMGVATGGVDVAVDLHLAPRRAPVAGALVLYTAMLLWSALHLPLWLARKRGLPSAGRLASSGRCFSCGYEAGNLAPCPECGAKDPRALPPAIYLGPWHMRIAVSRWHWLIPAAIALVALVLCTLPLTVGVARSI